MEARDSCLTDLRIFIVKCPCGDHENAPCNLLLQGGRVANATLPTTSSHWQGRGPQVDTFPGDPRTPLTTNFGLETS